MVFDRMQLLFPEMEKGFTSATVLLANTYAAHGHFDKAFNARKQIDQLGSKKKTGLSWTVIDGKIAVGESHSNRLLIRVYFSDFERWISLTHIPKRSMLKRNR